MKAKNELIGGNCTVVGQIKGENKRLVGLNGWYPRLRLFLTPGGKLQAGLYSEMNVVDFLSSLDYEDRYAPVLDEVGDIGRAVIIVNTPIYLDYRIGKTISYIKGVKLDRGKRNLGGNPNINYDLIEAAAAKNKIK